MRASLLLVAPSNHHISSLAGSLVAGAEALREIIEDEDVDPATRLKGIELLYNRVLGLRR